jgi:hypothetical protein
VALPPAVASLPLGGNGSWPVPLSPGRLPIRACASPGTTPRPALGFALVAGEITPSRQIAGRRGVVPPDHAPCARAAAGFLTRQIRRLPVRASVSRSDPRRRDPVCGGARSISGWRSAVQRAGAADGRRRVETRHALVARPHDARFLRRPQLTGDTLGGPETGLTPSVQRVRERRPQHIARRVGQVPVEVRDRARALPNGRVARPTTSSRAYR